MKLRFIISILFIVCINTKMFAIVSIENAIYQENNKQIVDTANATSMCQIDISKDCGGLSRTSLFDQKSRNLTLYSIIVAVFGIIVGVITSMAIAVHNNHREDIKELKREVAERIKSQDNQIQEGIDEINRIRSDVETRTNEIERMQSQQNYQIQYLERINQYLFSITNSIIDINGGNDETVLAIRNSLCNQYYIVKTFLPWSDGPVDSTQAAFMYLQFNGTKDNIDDLQFIADNDPDERKRRMAQETIGYIRARLMNDQA